MEEALGGLGQKIKKPEYPQRSAKNQGGLWREQTTRFKTPVPSNKR
jgi:hypothetical protein